MHMQPMFVGDDSQDTQITVNGRSRLQIWSLIRAANTFSITV